MCGVKNRRIGMKKIICLLALGIAFLTTAPSFAAPPGGSMGHGPSMGGRPPMHGGASMNRPPMGMNRPAMGRPPMGPPPMHMARRPLPPPPMYRPMPFYRPYYYSYYYPSYYSTSYTYYPTRYYSDIVEPASTSTSAVIVRDDYAGINTAANVINAAANVASTIRYLTW